MLFRSTVTVADAEAAKTICLESDKNQKPPSFQQRFLNWFFGKLHVVSANGDDWKRMRKSMDPAFYKLDVFVDIFADKTNHCLQTAKVNEPIKIYDYVQRMVCNAL